MKYRKLRITWSVMWGLVCALLIVFWVRSYWRFDTAEGNLGRDRVRLLMASGSLRVDWTSPNSIQKWMWLTEIIEGEVGLNPFDSDGGKSYSCKLFNISSSPRRTLA